jgi:hypothetical protein
MAAIVKTIRWVGVRFAANEIGIDLQNLLLSEHG